MVTSWESRRACRDADAGGLAWACTSTHIRKALCLRFVNFTWRDILVEIGCVGCYCLDTVLCAALPLASETHLSNVTLFQRFRSPLTSNEIMLEIEVLEKEKVEMPALEAWVVTALFSFSISSVRISLGPHSANPSTQTAFKSVFESPS